MTGPGWRAAVVLMAAATLATGCSAGVDSLSLPTVTSVADAGLQTPFPTLPPNLAATAENPVGGTTTTTAPAIGPGPATINGTVLGPSGPVGGAVVQADRLVGDAVASTRTTTAADGSWSLRNVLGGRYRIRAWRSPDLDVTTPQILFLTASQPQSISLQLTAYPSPQVSAAVNPDFPVQGQPVSLVVQVMDPTVDADGVLVYHPVAGTPVTLVDGPGWQVAGANPAVTDGGGRALFTVSCTTAGPDPLSAQPAGAAVVALQMPQCTAPPPDTSLTGPGGQPGTGQPATGSTTTTTCPNGTSPTTVYEPNATTTTLVFGNC